MWFLLGTIVCSFVEWAMHKYFMHGKWMKRFEKHRWLRQLATPYKNHTEEHHAAFHPPNPFAAEPGLYHYMFGKTSGMPKVLLVWLVLCIGIGHWLTPAMGWGLGLSGSTYVIVYELLHWHLHMERSAMLKRTRIYEFLEAHHKIHHSKYGKNLNVVLPLADLIFGTLVVSQ